MKVWSRKRQSSYCMFIVLVGLAVLIMITNYMRKNETITMLEETQVVQDAIVPDAQQELMVNVEDLMKFLEVPLNKENVIAATKLLLGNPYLKAVDLQNTKLPYTITLNYETVANDINLSMIKKDQLAIANAVTLMSLFEEIETVKIAVVRGEESYQKVIYKPDIEHYFSVSLSDIQDEKTFERLAEEFLEIDNVNTYWDKSHPYDSQLGEDVEAYFKSYFSSRQDEMPILPQGQEEVEETLKKKYGHRLYIEGLKYDNIHMNYYCVNRLMTYYESLYLEEILIEIIACSNERTNEIVQAACDKAKALLTYKEQEPIVFDLFAEIKGENILYKMMDGECSPFATWIGNEDGKIICLDYSYERTYALCQIITNQNKYFYSLPLYRGGSYILSEDEAKQGEIYITQELLQAFNQYVANRGEEINQEVVCEWLVGPYILLKGDNQYIYSCKTQKFMEEEQFLESFSKNEFLDCVQDTHEVSEFLQVSKDDLQVSLSSVEIDGQRINIYEFDTVEKKNKLLKQSTKSPPITDEHTWDKGKIIIGYDGNSDEMIALLDTIMK